MDKRQKLILSGTAAKYPIRSRNSGPVEKRQPSSRSKRELLMGMGKVCA